MVGNNSLGSSGEGFLLTTDGTGNEQIRRHYFVGSASGFSDVVPLSDGGYLLSGGVRISDAQLWLMRVNSAGDPVWPQKIWGGPFDEAGAKCMLATDGQIVVTGDWAYANIESALKC